MQLNIIILFSLTTKIIINVCIFYLQTYNVSIYNNNSFKIGVYNIILDVYNRCV